MAYVAPPTKTDGDGFSAAEFNQNVRDNVEFLYEPPRCLLNHNLNQTIANNTITALLFNQEIADNDSMHSLLSNTSRITVNTAGVYALTAAVQFDGNTTGVRTVSIVMNGSDTLVTQDAENLGTNSIKLNVATLYYLDVNDYVEVRVRQDSGGNLDSETGAGLPNFRVAWIGG